MLSENIWILNANYSVRIYSGQDTIGLVNDLAKKQALFMFKPMMT